MKNENLNTLNNRLKHNLLNLHNKENLRVSSGLTLTSINKNAYGYGNINRAYKESIEKFEKLSEILKETDEYTLSNLVKSRSEVNEYDYNTGNLTSSTSSSVNPLLVDETGYIGTNFYSILSAISVLSPITFKTLKPNETLKDIFIDILPLDETFSASFSNNTSTSPSKCCIVVTKYQTFLYDTKSGILATLDLSKEAVKVKTLSSNSFFILHNTGFIIFNIIKNDSGKYIFNIQTDFDFSELLKETTSSNNEIDILDIHRGNQTTSLKEKLKTGNSPENFLKDVYFINDPASIKPNAITNIGFFGGDLGLFELKAYKPNTNISNKTYYLLKIKDEKPVSQITPFSLGGGFIVIYKNRGISFWKLKKVNNTIELNQGDNSSSAPPSDNYIDLPPDYITNNNYNLKDVIEILHLYEHPILFTGYTSPTPPYESPIGETCSTISYNSTFSNQHIWIKSVYSDSTKISTTKYYKVSNASLQDSAIQQINFSKYGLDVFSEMKITNLTQVTLMSFVVVYKNQNNSNEVAKCTFKEISDGEFAVNLELLDELQNDAKIATLSTGSSIIYYPSSNTALTFTLEGDAYSFSISGTDGVLGLTQIIENSEMIGITNGGVIFTSKIKFVAPNGITKSLKDELIEYLTNSDILDEALEKHYSEEHSYYDIIPKINRAVYEWASNYEYEESGKDISSQNGGTYVCLNYPMKAPIWEEFTYNNPSPFLYGFSNSPTARASNTYTTAIERQSHVGKLESEYFDMLLNTDGNSLLFSGSNVSYCSTQVAPKIWLIKIKIPSTATFYINNVEHWSESQYAGNYLPRKNLGGGVIPGKITEACTKYKLILNKTYFHISSILHSSASLSTPPLQIYSDDSGAVYDTPNMEVSLLGIENGANEVALTYLIFGGDGFETNILIKSE